MNRGILAHVLRVAAVTLAASGCHLIASLDETIESDLQCNDQVDNDADGKLDCEDEGCSAFAGCAMPINCGNGRVDPQEQCDDNNLANGDGCSAVCKFESELAVVEPVAPGMPNCRTLASGDGRAIAFENGVHALYVCGNQMFVTSTIAVDGAWGPPQPLPIPADRSILSAEIAASQGTLHVAARNETGVFYTRSVDKGLTWSTSMLLSESLFPAQVNLSIDAGRDIVYIIVSGQGEVPTVFLNRDNGGTPAWSAVPIAFLTMVTNCRFLVRFVPTPEPQLPQFVFLGEDLSNGNYSAFTGNGAVAFEPIPVPAPQVGTSTRGSWAFAGDSLFSAAINFPDVRRFDALAVGNFSMFSSIGPPLPPTGMQGRSIAAAAGAPFTILVAQNDPDGRIRVHQVGAGPPQVRTVVASQGQNPHVGISRQQIVVVWTVGDRIFAGRKPL